MKYKEINEARENQIKIRRSYFKALNDFFSKKRINLLELLAISGIILGGSVTGLSYKQSLEKHH